MQAIDTIVRPIRSTQCTIERDFFLFPLLKYKRFLDLHREYTERERETVTTTA